MANLVNYLSRSTKVKIGPEEIQPAPNIAAIDFGSSCVSVAYSIEGRKDIHMLPLHRDYERVPNAILIRKENNRVEVFGQNAQEGYHRMPQFQKNNFVYFERIKILLARIDAVHRMSIVWSHTGGSYYLVEVIAFIIKYLKERLLWALLVVNEINKYNSSDFDWVITVPAIWKASAKRIMREAAHMAGLTSDDYPSITAFTPVGNEIQRPPEINPDKLFLALESEVAAIYTQSEVRESAGRVPLPQCYMVVDIGGGTVDITVHNQNDSKTVHVLIPPIGNMWGGVTVNQAFEHLLEKVFDDKGFQKYFKKYPNDATCIYNLVHVEFENEKKSFGNNPDCNSKRSLTIPLPTQVVKFYKEKNIKKRVESMQAEYINDTIILEYDKVREIMFQPTVDSILECVMNTLRGLPYKVDTIYIVGGFGGCEFMYSAIHSALTKHKGTLYDNIFRPHLPDLAVVKGAVMWRQDPSIIQSRRADATYGDEEYAGCTDGTWKGMRLLKKSIENPIESLMMNNDATRSKNEKEIIRLTKEKKDIERENERLVRELSSESELLQKEKAALEEEKIALQKMLQEFRGINQQLQGENQQLLEQNQQLLWNQHELQEKVEVLTNSWKISYKDVKVTKEELGRGGWGVIWIGQFRGQKVAVKQMYALILSEDNLVLLHREINTMSQLRHPNLVQFIGAVLDDPSGNPMIVTEIMDVSLRGAYEKKQLTPVPVHIPLAIMRDVAVGLNYLHCLPDPIIHRDVSSANVLLESKGHGKWKTKISDFGSAKFARSAVTKAAGSLVYSAPESVNIIVDDDEYHPLTPKMDVFSYGVLLCEILTCQFPDQQVFRAMLGQVRSQHQPYLHDLLHSCIKRNPQDRPDMDQVIQQLDK